MPLFSYYIMGAVLYAAFFTGFTSFLIEKNMINENLPELLGSPFSIIIGLVFYPINILWYIFSGFAYMIDWARGKKE